MQALQQHKGLRHGRHGPAPFGARPPQRAQVVVRNNDIRGAKMEQGLFGQDFGARDPTIGELSTGFGEKVLGNFNTEHIIKPPDTIHKFLGLSAKHCKDNAGSLKLLGDEERELLRQQVPGWRVTAVAGGTTCIQQEWKLKDAACADKLCGMLKDVAQSEGHQDCLTVTQQDTSISAQLCTASLGGLTENDFIVASKINDLQVTDLLQKKKQRFWA